MLMYELWRVSPREDIAVRLEDAEGPVLFLRTCDAEEYARSEEKPRLRAMRIIAVRVGPA